MNEKELEQTEREPVQEPEAEALDLEIEVLEERIAPAVYE